MERRVNTQKHFCGRRSHKTAGKSFVVAGFRSEKSPLFLGRLMRGAPFWRFSPFGKIDGGQRLRRAAEEVEVPKNLWPRQYVVVGFPPFV